MITNNNNFCGHIQCIMKGIATCYMTIFILTVFVQNGRSKVCI